MTINGWSVANANARQWNVRRGYAAITNQSEWIAGSNNPAFFSGKAGFKTLQVVLIVKASSKENVQLGISSILSKLKDPAEIILDNYVRRFYGILRSYSVDESTQRRTIPFHKLTLNLEGYEFASEITATGNSLITANNPGTLLTPAIVTVSATRAVSNITISGLGNAIVLKNVLANKQYVINGETGLITVDGALANVDIWNLPVLQPGNNTVTCSESTATVTIRYKPRYM